FYASRAYVAGRKLPERRDEWKGHSIIGFADRASNADLARWSDNITHHGNVVMRCSSQGDMLAAVRPVLVIPAVSCFVADPTRVFCAFSPKLTSRWAAIVPIRLYNQGMRRAD